MPDPLFDSRTARFDLPLLFAGQAQKEAFVNELAARVDAALHCAIEGVLAAPPATPGDGQAWLVGASPTGDWAGHSGQIAARQAGNWLFLDAVPGMRVFNRATGQFLHYTTAWQTPPRPAAPTGGTVIDAEARAAIGAILSLLTNAGVLAAP